MIYVVISTVIGFLIGIASSMCSRSKLTQARVVNILATTLGSLFLASVITLSGADAPVLFAAVVGALIPLMVLLTYRTSILSKTT